MLASEGLRNAASMLHEQIMHAWPITTVNLRNGLLSLLVPFSHLASSQIPLCSVAILAQGRNRTAVPNGRELHSSATAEGCPFKLRARLRYQFRLSKHACVVTLQQILIDTLRFLKSVMFPADSLANAPSHFQDLSSLLCGFVSRGADEQLGKQVRFVAVPNI